MGVRGPTSDERTARPQDRVEALAGLLGRDGVVAWCSGLVTGADPHDPTAPDLDWLGGESSAARVAKGLDLDYWPRVWGARGLLHCYQPSADRAVASGLTDPAWRVREMCAKVVRAHEIGAVADGLGRLLDDPVPRVRAAAARAVGAVAEADVAPILVRVAEGDRESTARQAAERALADLRRRLDRPLRPSCDT